MNRTPVVFIHGAWLHALSWESWAERFAGRGFLAHAPGWPQEKTTVRETRTSPDALHGIGLDTLTQHYAGIVSSFDTEPVIVGHSVGGLIAQHLIGANVGRAAVAIAPAPVDGIPLSVAQQALWTPGRGDTGPLVSLSPRQFHQVFANTVELDEADRLFERYVVPAPRRLLTDVGRVGTVRRHHTAVDVNNKDRGPLLLISGQEDRLVPDAVTRAVYKAYGDSTATTDLKQFADRGHSLVIDGGWRFVADYVLGWLEEHGIRALPADG